MLSKRVWRDSKDLLLKNKRGVVWLICASKQRRSCAVSTLDTNNTPVLCAADVTTPWDVTTQPVLCNVLKGGFSPQLDSYVLMLHAEDAPHTIAPVKGLLPATAAIGHSGFLGTCQSPWVLAQPCLVAARKRSGRDRWDCAAVAGSLVINDGTGQPCALHKIADVNLDLEWQWVTCHRYIPSAMSFCDSTRLEPVSSAMRQWLVTCVSLSQCWWQADPKAC